MPCGVNLAHSIFDWPARRVEYKPLMEPLQLSGSSMQAAIDVNM